MGGYILDLKDIDKTKLHPAGGKGANLGELFRIEGICVPDGFCISAEVYKNFISHKPDVNNLISELSFLKLNDRNKISGLCSTIRNKIEKIPIPENVTDEIMLFLLKYGDTDAYAVRSSATAEDLPDASFAGQQDTYLNITGKEAILKHISKCWASLFTERAVTYRIQNGFDHQKVYLSVIIQKMIFPEISGIMFTADPVNGNRKVISVDASFGLGESLVSGRVNADNYKVFDGRIIEKKVSSKKLVINALKNGGTIQQSINSELQNRQALTDEQIIQLAELGKKIEKHFGSPQDIEWCLADERFYIVQSRPVTTLFPVPDSGDNENHVYISVGHQQMMTDPMKPLGLSFFLLTTQAPMKIAGGRLFVDVTKMLAAPGTRHTLINTLGRHDPLIKDALETIIKREGFINPLPENNSGVNKQERPSVNYNALIDFDPVTVTELIREAQASIKELKESILTRSGTELFDFILEDIAGLKKFMSDARSMNVIMTAMNAATWINENIYELLGEKNAADTLTLSVPNNITSEMGIALMEVADVIRPYPDVVKYLSRCTRTDDDNFQEELLKLKGGKEAYDAIHEFLKKYGMRCPGEIDITKTRWSEKPSALFPVILSNIKNFESGAGKQKFEQGQQEALKKEQELLNRLKQLPGGEEKAMEAKRMTGLLRNLSGYREYPKYFMINRYLIYKQALLKEADLLLQDNVIHEKEDIYYLNFDEFREVVRLKEIDYGIINKRKKEYRLYKKLTPPRVITSDGEIIRGKYKMDSLPADAIIGLPVSAGITEGRARVILNMEDADLEEGDILVTPFTDPSWTPLFLSIKGLVTEVGGLMTHGAVIAREYGLPAIVGVENATKLIKNGQLIRINGTEGYIEFI